MVWWVDLKNGNDDWAGSPEPPAFKPLHKALESNSWNSGDTIKVKPSLASDGTLSYYDFKNEEINLNTSNNFVLITNLILERIGTDQNDFEYITTLTYAINSQWVSFIEAHGINSDFYAENMLKFGTAYLSNENLQLDASLVINFKNTPRIFYINFGGSYRFDLHKDSE